MAEWVAQILRGGRFGFPPARLAKRRSPRPSVKTNQRKRDRRQRQRKFKSAIAHQPVLKVHLPDRHAHLDRERKREKAREQSQHDPDSAKEFRPRRKIRQPARNPERAHHVHVVMESAKHFVIAMRDHDRSQNKPHHKQRQRLQPIEKIQACLSRIGFRSQVSRNANLRKNSVSYQGIALAIPQVPRSPFGAAPALPARVCGAVAAHLAGAAVAAHNARLRLVDRLE
jgi:hypothetical protein